jgi:hypothetical protein
VSRKSKEPAGRPRYKKLERCGLFCVLLAIFAEALQDAD